MVKIWRQTSMTENKPVHRCLLWTSCLFTGRGQTRGGEWRIVRPAAGQLRVEPLLITAGLEPSELFQYLCGLKVFWRASNKTHSPGSVFPTDQRQQLCPDSNFFARTEGLKVHGSSWRIHCSITMRFHLPSQKKQWWCIQMLSQCQKSDISTDCSVTSISTQACYKESCDVLLILKY